MALYVALSFVNMTHVCHCRRIVLQQPMPNFHLALSHQLNNHEQITYITTNTSIKLSHNDKGLIMLTCILFARGKLLVHYLQLDSSDDIHSKRKHCGLNK